MLLRIKNRLEELETLQSALETFAAEHSLPAKTTGETRLILEELLVNIISHAYPDQGVHEIIFTLERVDDVLRIECIDDGVAFDPLMVPEPDTTLSLAERHVGGLGIHFIRAFSDNLTYQREHGKNILRISKFIPVL